MTKGKKPDAETKSLKRNKPKKLTVGLLGWLRRVLSPFRKVPANALGGHDKPKVMGPQNHKT